MAIPGIVSGSEVEVEPVAPQLNAAPFRQAALARGKLGAAIGDDIADFSTQVGQKFQQNRNARTILDADMKMAKLTQNYRDSLAKNPDEKSWIPGYQQQTQQLRDQILDGPDVGPDVRNVLTAKLDRWEQATTSEIKTAAQVQSLNRTKQTVIADYSYWAQMGQPENAENAIKLGESAHALFPEDAARMRRNLPALVQRGQVDTGIINDPGKTLELLKDQDASGHSKAFPNIDTKTLVTLISTATRQRNAQQSENAQDLREQMEQSADGTLPPKMISAQVKSGAITQRQADALTALMTRAKVNEAKANAGELMGRVSLYDPADDKDGSQLKELKSDAIGLPKSYYDSIMQTLNKKVKEGRGEGDNGEKVIDRLYQAGMLGNWEVTDPETGKRTRDKTLFMKANEQRWDLQDALDKWRKDNPNGSLHDEREYVMQLSQPSAVESVKSSLPIAPAADVKGAQRRQNGKLYEFDGKDWNEVK